MKKLCRSRGAVHPSPSTISDHLAFLPAYLLALTAYLSSADLEVLAYLISSVDTAVPPSKKGYRKNTSSAAAKGRAAGLCSVLGGDDSDHDPNFSCDCFRCYMSYWVRWDKSPNRQLIDEIIDAYEAGLDRDVCGGSNNGRGGRGRKERKKVRGFESAAAAATGEAESSAGVVPGGDDKGSREAAEEVGGLDRDEADDDEDKGSVRRLVSFIGERIWGVWN